MTPTTSGTPPIPRLSYSRDETTVQHQGAVGLFHNSPLAYWHEPGARVGSFDDFDVDPEDGAVQREVLFEAGVDPDAGERQGVLDDLVEQPDTDGCR
jgi:hypothetical protein